MDTISYSYVKEHIAKSDTIFKRGENLFALGNYSLIEEADDTGKYIYTFDGSYGDYTVTVAIKGEVPTGTCTCPYPHRGCKHLVAACLDIGERKRREKKLAGSPDSRNIPQEYLTPEEIKAAALESRRERAKKEGFVLFRGETYKGRHTVRTPKGKEYTVTVYNPAEQSGHCTCPDFATNHLDTCKHLIFAYNQLSKDKNFLQQAETEQFPFVHFTWNSRLGRPCCYYEKLPADSSHIQEVRKKLQTLFNEKGVYTRDSATSLYRLYSDFSDDVEALQFDERLLERMEEELYEKEMNKLEKQLNKKGELDLSFLQTSLYPYQLEGVRFAVFNRSAIIADEMGLGKTLQAITAAIVKSRIFGFQKVLVISPSSLKSQWEQEIRKYTDASAVVVSGSRKQRHSIYFESTALFKITNYEAVLRDNTTISRWGPDFVILDEAQRIKNFETKTHQAIRAIPHSHSLVITGTPLENKLEDLYSIVQFCDPGLLTPLWAFAAHHFNLSKQKKNKVLGYRNLDGVYKKIQPLLLRRKKKDVIKELPEIIENNYYVDLSQEQEEIHQGYMATLFMLSNKKVLTPMDIKRMQKTLLAMRMVCDSTYLIDKKTNISPKLVELVSILRELVLENNRKVVIFSEWTTMTYLIGKTLSELGIDFVEFTGKVPVEKRQALIDEFRENPECMVFLSSDAGGVGLNLQNTDCVINFELPWNPAKLNQRIGRVHRIGQKSGAINAINLITKNSLEERVYAGINLKQELFDAALEGSGTEVDLSRENKNKFVNQIRALFDGEQLEPGEGVEKAPPPELDEQTPHYLNPEIFKEKESEIDIEAEEFGEEEPRTDREETRTGGAPENERTAEQLEAVLNQGMEFLNSLSLMASGKPLDRDTEKKSVEIDRETGEVVMRFKLPGF
jgi:hypothetical protein